MSKGGITIESVHQAYLESADYDITCDLGKARTFIVAVRRMMSFAQSSANQSSSMSFDLGLLKSQLDTAIGWLNANDTSGPSGAGTGSSGIVSDDETRCFGFGGFER